MGAADAQAAVVERLPQWGRVVPWTPVPWMVVGPNGQAVRPIEVYLTDFAAGPTRPSSVRSYAYDLLRWWRWLVVSEVPWNRATSEETGPYVLWLKSAVKPRNKARTTSLTTAGTANPITRKTNLDDRYQPRTIRHSNAVIRSFYEFAIDSGSGPLINPMPLGTRRGWRRTTSMASGYERPEFETAIRYNPRVPKRSPRAMPDEQWNAVFGALSSNRDRAIVAAGVSSAARPAELLGMSGVDLDWGDQLIRVVRKARGPSSGCPRAPRRSCGSGCICPNWGRSCRASRCGRRCAAETAVPDCGGSR